MKWLDGHGGKEGKGKWALLDLAWWDVDGVKEEVHGQALWTQAQAL
jgi:hypothetical protein